jgi:hypothetical protein
LSEWVNRINGFKEKAQIEDVGSIPNRLMELGRINRYPLPKNGKFLLKLDARFDRVFN